jgi:hypothetical protein
MAGAQAVIAASTTTMTARRCVDAAALPCRARVLHD